MAEKQDFRREKLLGRFIEKMLYRWNDRKFEKKVLEKDGKKLVEVELYFSGEETLNRE